MVKRSVEEHANTLEKWVKQGKQGSPPVLAATVILLRDGDTGLETLMLRRNSRIVFGGMWVFPGGRVDREDWEGVAAGDELAASRRAAARESIEECGLQVDPDSMLPFSHWTPPLVTPKRFLTWFFVARPREGDVAIDDGEIKESLWMSPEEALRRQNVQEIELAPPTYVTLSELSAFGDVDAALSAIPSIAFPSSRAYDWTTGPSRPRGTMSSSWPWTANTTGTSWTRAPGGRPTTCSR